MITGKTNTMDLIKLIVDKNYEIKDLFIHPYPDAPLLQDRVIFNDVEQAQYEKALTLRKNYNVPFWDALMLSFYNNQQFSFQILQNVLNSHKEREKILVTRENIQGNALLKACETNSNFALNSKVLTGENKIRHLILLDFHIPESDKNQKVVEAVLKILKVKSGYLLKSGKSYHYLGEDLITTAALTKFLGKCLFFTPIIDKSWLAHQFIDRSCSIRFTKKYNLFPTLIKRIEQ